MSKKKKQKSRKRAPWHLWVIGVLALLWSLMGAFDYLMTQTKNEAYMSNFTPEQLEFFYGLPTWVVSAWAIAVWSGLLGVVLLLVRRGIAVWVFLVSLVAMVLTTLHCYVFSSGLEVMGDPLSIFMTVAIFLIAAALLVYSWFMKKKGVLA